MTLGVLLLLPLVAVGFQVEPLERIPHFAERDISIIAHAGAQGHAPSNTMPAFEIALEQGADTLEMDLQVTADGEIVVIHDGTVDRTTDGEGAVADLTLAELKELDAGWYYEADDGTHPFRGQGVEIPTLAEVFAAFPDTYLIIELKTDGGTAIIQPVIDLVVEHGREDSVAIASFDLDYLRPVREQLPGVPTNMPEAEGQAYYVLHLVGLHPWWEPPGRLFQVPEFFDANLYGLRIDDLRVVAPRFIRGAERFGVDVQVWTVNEVEDMHRILDAGAHAILTDHPDRMVEVLAEREAQAAVDPEGYGTQLDRAERLQAELPWLTPIFQVLTFFGDEEFYILVFPILYWALSRRIGVRIAVMLLVSASLNGVLKLVWTTPRPSFFRPELGQVTETSFGLPSGHAQNAVSVWGALAVSLRRHWWAVVGLVALILAIGWSRIHLGIHFLEDMLVGWSVGLVLLGLMVWLEPRVVAWWQRNGTGERVLAGIVASLVFITPAVLLSRRLTGVRFDWPAAPSPEELTGAAGVVLAAAGLAGFVAGLALIQRRGGFDHRGPVGQRVLRVLVGLVGVVVIWQGLGAVFPGGEDGLALTLRYVRYGLVGLWVSGVAPVLFVRFALAARGDEPVPDRR